MAAFLPGIPQAPAVSYLARGFFRDEMAKAGETPVAARQRAAHFQWLRQNPALYRDFLNRAGGVPVESK